MSVPDHRDTLRLLPGGAGESGATVTYKLEDDDTSLGTATTDSNGRYSKDLADTAVTGQASYVIHPGPYRTEATVGSYTRKHSSTSIGSAGPINLAALVQLNRAIGNGLVSSPANGLNTGEVTSAGAARTVVVDTFACVIEGLPAQNQASRTVTISANTSGDPRIDTVVVEMIPAGNDTEGRCVLKVVEGTAAADPEAPTLTQSTTAWQLPLADVAVANGASVITTGNITDRRDYVERSVTAVEADVVQLQSDVTALEAPVVPRLDIVGYYRAAYDPPALSTHSGVATTVPITFVNDYTSLLATDLFEASHKTIDQNGSQTGRAAYSSATEALYAVWNNWPGGTINFASATLTIVVRRLVLA